MGGSFYTIRKIVQELEYRSKASSAGTGTGSSPVRWSNKEIKISEDVEIRTEFHEIAVNDVEPADATDRHLEAAKVESLASSATTDKHLQAAKVESLASSATERILFEETEKPRTLVRFFNMWKKVVFDSKDSLV